VGQADQHARPGAHGVTGERVHHAALADTCVPQDGHERPRSPRRPIESLVQSSQLLVATDERHPARLGLERCRQRPGRAASQNLLVQLLGVGLRPHAELPLEPLHAVLVLTKRGRAPTMVGVETHERPVHRLLQRVEAEQLEGRLHRRVGLALSLVCQQPGQGLHCELPQPLLLSDQPLLEGRLVH
jgi:hypothetical protein